MTALQPSAFDDCSKVSVSHPETIKEHDQMSLAKVLDPYGFKRFFKYRFSQFLQANYRNAEEVAVVYGVRYQTSLNWWQGVNAPSGDTTTLVSIRHGSAFTDFMASEE